MNGISSKEFTLPATMGEINRGGLPELIKFSRQVGKSRGKSGKVGEIPTFPDFLLKIGKSRDVTRLSSIFPDFSRLFPVFLT